MEPFFRTGQTSPFSVLFFQPLSKHAISSYPIIASFLLSHSHVSVVGDVSLAESLQFYLRNLNYSPNYSFYRYAAWKIFHLTLLRWDMLVMTPRLFASKRLHGANWGTAHHVLAQLALLILLCKTKMKKIPIIMDLHNVGMFEHRNPISRARIPLFLERALLRLFYPQVRAINVLDIPIKQELVTRTQPKIPVVISPPTVFWEKERPRSAQPDPPPLTVVMTGRISQRRKHYRWMRLVPEDIRFLVRLEFLGTPDTIEDSIVTHQARILGFQGEFETRAQRFSMHEFARICSTAHVLLANVNCLVGDRRLGKDTITGAILDAMQFGLPLLIPEAVPVGERFTPSLVPYKDEEHLAAILTRWTRNPSELTSHQRIARENAEHSSAQAHNYAAELRSLVACCSLHHL